ncbi:unnamed protein product, partial [Mesorhabditis belari]|uniref:protein-tyrosine-phosphatase n=1 Tax=Mesorhabditis belari TaxID=2138241 RepID=A0AAF3J7T6_9BILA
MRDAAFSSTSSRSQSLRSRTSSTASTAIESTGPHFYLSRRDSKISIASSQMEDVASVSPSTSMMTDSSVKGRVIQVMPPSLIRKRTSISNSDSPVICDESMSHQGFQPNNGNEGSSSSLLVRQNTAPSLSNSKFIYLNEVVWQIDETVYCGGRDSYTNQTMLCRLNIEYIVDLSGMNDDDQPRRGDLHCLCQKRHARTIMTIKVPDFEEETNRPVSSKLQKPTVNLMDLFREFTEMAAKAKGAGKALLVYSRDGRNRAPAFACAYVMHNMHCTRMQALSKVKNAMINKRPSVQIDDNLQRGLMRWQTTLGIKPSDAGDPDYTVPLFTVKRTAWT